MATPSTPGKGAAEPELRHQGSRSVGVPCFCFCNKRAVVVIARIPLGVIVNVTRAIVPSRAPPRCSTRAISAHTIPNATATQHPAHAPSAHTQSRASATATKHTRHHLTRNHERAPPPRSTRAINACVIASAAAAQHTRHQHTRHQLTRNHERAPRTRNTRAISQCT